MEKYGETHSARRAQRQGGGTDSRVSTQPGLSRLCALLSGGGGEGWSDGRTASLQVAQGEKWRQAALWANVKLLSEAVGVEFPSPICPILIGGAAEALAASKCATPPPRWKHIRRDTCW